MQVIVEVARFSTRTDGIRLALALATALAPAAAYAARCADYRSCREAVVAWCAGRHPGADGDGDGIR